MSTAMSVMTQPYPQPSRYLSTGSAPESHGIELTEKSAGQGDYFALVPDQRQQRPVAQEAPRNMMAAYYSKRPGGSRLVVYLLAAIGLILLVNMLSRRS